MTPKNLKTQFDKFVIKQEEAKKTISSLIYMQFTKLQKPEHRFPQSNLLLIGDTGTGKSYMTSLITDNLDLPMITIDCSRISADGYQGDTLISYFQNLLVYDEDGICGKQATHEGLCGIVIFDEFDKIRIDNSNRHGAYYKNLIQQEMLRILEGDKIKIPIGTQKVTSDGKTYMFDTRKLLIICTGAFPDLFEEEKVDKVAGFNCTPNKPKKIDVLERLKNYGFIPELIGRLANVVVMDKLNEDDLYKIVTETEYNPLYEMIETLRLLDINVIFSEAALRKMCKDAIALKTGARGIRKLVNDILNPLVYEYGGEHVCIHIKEDYKPLLVLKNGNPVIELG